MDSKLRFVIYILTLAVCAAGNGTASGTTVQAAGPVVHHLEEANDFVFHDCDGEGFATLHYFASPTRLLVTTADDACTPGFSLLTFCALPDPDGSLRCELHNANNNVSVLLAPDGAFFFSWEASTFYETLQGVLTRIDG